MKEKRETRSAWIKLRATPAEKEIIAEKASAQGQTMTDFIRQRALDYRLRQTPLDQLESAQLDGAIAGLAAMLVKKRSTSAARATPRTA